MDLSRRFLLRGAVEAASVVVALPILDCFLNDNGTALASGAPLPTRFGTWEWGCGMTPEFWTPKKTGADYDIVREIEPLAPYKKDLTILSGQNAFLDGLPNTAHVSAIWGQRTGTVPVRADIVDAPSLDVIVADKIGTGSRFRSLEMAAVGSAKASYSRRNASTVNPSMVSPMEMYQRIFGDGFTDPNSGEFKPDPDVLVRKSVLSGVTERRHKLLASVGAADRQRLDQYFTSIRQLENQLALQLEKPAPAESCVVPRKMPEKPVGADIELVKVTHKQMTDLLVMAVACNQTRVFNMVFSSSASELHRIGSTTNHHMLTHEEPVDEKLGYQPQASWFVVESMKALAEFVGAMAAVKEGDGRLLDHMLIYAHSDTSFAKVHSLEDMPVILAGSAGGKMKTGLHIPARGTPVTRSGLTAMAAMGVSIDKWGTKSMETNKMFSELFV